MLSRWVERSFEGRWSASRLQTDSHMKKISLVLRGLGSALLVFFSLFAEAQIVAGPATSFEEGHCSLVNLSRDPRFPPHRNQGNKAWCFAMATADMLSFYEGEEVSAVDLAIESAYQKSLLENHPYQIPVGGRVDEVLNFAQKFGYCPNDRAPSFVNQRPDEAYKALTDPKLYTYAVSALYPGISVSGPLSVQNFDQDLRSLTAAACGVRQPLKNSYSLHQVFADWSERFSSLDRREPSLLQVDAQKLFGAQGYHSMVLVGRKWNSETNTCDYLVRNSWDFDCGAIPNKRIYCDGQGNTWVPGDLLNGSLLGALQYYVNQ